MPVRLPRSAENDLVIIAPTRLAERNADLARRQWLLAYQELTRRLALKLAESLRRTDLTNDLVLEAMSALDRAIDQFEPHPDVAYDSQPPHAGLWNYSRPRVISAVLDYLGKTAAADLRRRKDAAHNVLRAHDEILRSGGKKPTPAEIAAKLNLAEEAVEDALGLISIAGDKIFSLLASATSREQGVAQSPGAGQSSEEQSGTKEQSPELMRALRHLRSPHYGGRYEQACDLFALHYFEGVGVAETAKAKGLDQTAVRQELEKIKPALNHLTTHLSDDVLMRYRARNATMGQREHVEMHLAETSPGAHYCQPCHERLAALK